MLLLTYASATLPAADVLTLRLCRNICQQGELGELTAGAAADLVLVEGDPLDDIGVLANSSNIKLVIKHGLLAKVRVLDDTGVCLHTMNVGTVTGARSVGSNSRFATG